MMNWIVATGLVLTFVPAPVGAQTSRTATDSTGAPCLTEEQVEGNKKLLALDRPVKKEDPEWIFNPDYFLGTWSFEWTVPESPLGPSSELTGTVTFKHIEGCYYEGELQAKDQDLTFKQRIQFIADPTNRWMTWIETDSRGFTLIKSGSLGGDLGGYFTHYWEVPVFTYKGKKVRLKGNHFLASPGNFRYRMQMSVDGGSYRNFGNPWFRKGPTTAPPTAKDRQ
jgi:hypothetical protein